MVKSIAKWSWVAFTGRGSRPGALSKDRRRWGLVGRLLSLLLSRTSLSRAAARRFVLIEGVSAFNPLRKRAFYFRLGVVQSRFRALRFRAQRQRPLILLSRQRIHSGVQRRLGGGQRVLHFLQPLQV